MLTHRNCYINAYNFIAHLRIQHEDVELWTLPMFHANGWGGPFAITAMGATHVVLRAVSGPDIYRAHRARGRDVRLHGAGGAQHDPELPRRGEAQDHDAAAVRRRRRAAARRLHRAA